MENVAELTKPPFDKPISFIKLFDAKIQNRFDGDYQSGSGKRGSNYSVINNEPGTEIHPYSGWIFVPGLFCSGMGAPLCRSRMDSHCTDRRGVQRGKAPFGSGSSNRGRVASLLAKGV